MAMFRYTAKNTQGEDTAGVVDALSLEEALERLLDRGLRDVQVTHIQKDRDEPDRAAEAIEMAPALHVPGTPCAKPPVSLSSSDASELASQVAQVSAARVPLAAGLRAAAEETACRRVSLALRWIADQVDQGRSLEDTLTNSGTLLPNYISGLILAAVRTGTLGEALFELVEQQQSMRSVRSSIRQGFSYSLFVFVFAVPVLVFIGYYVTGQFREVFADFGLKLPVATELLFWWHDHGLFTVGYAVLATVLVVVYRVIGGRARWQRLMSTLPLLGALWQSTGVAEWSGLLSVLLKHEIPLPDALRLAGHGMRNAHIGHVSLRLADGVARGRKLSQLMFAYRELPSTLIPLVEWGEQFGALSESFRVGREMFEKRAEVRGTLLHAVVSPLLFIWIASAVTFMVVALFLPLIDLISKLS
jgi:type II secretory pathway component PulF